MSRPPSARISPPPSPRPPRVLLGATGSVATIKLGELAALFLARGCEVRVACTASARRFLPALQRPLPAACLPVLGDEDEWRAWARVGDPVLHIELRRWADVLVVAPLSANSLARCAHGLCDDLLSCVVRAWDYGAKPLVVAPAMNTLMWQHPLTSQQLGVLRGWGALVVPPVEKALACGDVGGGAMAAPADVVEAALRRLSGGGGGGATGPDV